MDLPKMYGRMSLLRLLERDMRMAPFLKSLIVSVVAAMTGIGVPSSALSAEPLRMLVGTMFYPLEVIDAKGQLSGGVIKDLGEQLAADLGTKVDFVVTSRRRMEPALITGEGDLFCYASPKWSKNAKEFLWSVPSLAQVERVVLLKNGVPPENIPDDFVGKRVAVRLGYHFDAIQPLFDSGKAKRIDETQVPLMFKAVEAGFADVLISSEDEIEGFFKKNADARKRFVVAPKVFSVTQTQCAVSRKSRWSLEKIDKALTAMLKRGDLDRMSQRYGMSMR